MRAGIRQIFDWIAGVWYCIARARHLANTIMNIDAQLQHRPTTQTETVVEAEIPTELLESLMQLRAGDTTIKGRTGQAVTVFIPEEVLVKIRPDGAKQKLFIDRVAKQLVRRALYGVWHVQAGTVEFASTKL